MTLFVVGNILLKIRRPTLPRPTSAGWFTVIFALVVTLSGLLGNIEIDRRNLNFFLSYFVPTVVVVGVMFLRIHILKLFLLMLAWVADWVGRFHNRLNEKIQKNIETINSLKIIFFTRGDDLASLNRAMLYVRQNELTKWVEIIHLDKAGAPIPEKLERDVQMLDEIYPEIKIELVLRKGDFSPDTVDQISREYGVAKNYMFIGAPGAKFPFGMEAFGGVRIII